MIELGMTVEDVPFTVPSKPLAASRIALVSTAGLHLEEQEPFDRATPSGDCSYRRIAADHDPSRLRIWWDAHCRQPASQDVNCAFPLALLRELCDAGAIGSIAATHYSFSGAIPEPSPLLGRTGPALARELKDGGVDAVLIAPS